MQSSIGPVEVGALTLINPDGIQLQSNIGEESAEGCNSKPYRNWNGVFIAFCRCCFSS